MSDTPRTDAVIADRKNYDTFGGWLDLEDHAIRLERELNAANARIAELEKDKARLDWLARNRSDSATDRPLLVTPKSLRDAIDAAIEPKP